MVKKFLGLLALALLALALVLAFNTWRKGSRQLDVPALAKVPLEEAAAAQRLAEAVRFKTVSSRDDPQLNQAEFLGFQQMLERHFPRVHRQLQREKVGHLALLYTWQGSDPKAAPAMLMAHQDVVPIAPGTDSDWEQPPFSGVLKDGYVWGRGSWDNKGNLMAQLEAIEQLLAEGYQPTRTLYLAYGADEEVGGTRGAAHIAELLASRQVHLDFVIDEGLLVLSGVMPGIQKTTAIVGVAEKGNLLVRMKVSGTPGHSSMPPPRGEGVIAMMGAALQQLDAHPLPGGIRGVAADMFDTLAPEMGGLNRVLLSNLWLFRPLVQRQLEQAASTNAMLRTTTALTILNAGNKENVLPGRAEAIVNFRILPGDDVEHVMQHMKTQVQQVAPRAELEPLPGAHNPSKVAPTDSRQYRLLNQTIREVFPDALVAPGLMVAATDSAHYDRISDHIFKFSPVRANAEDLKRFHGTNERLSVSHYADAIRFYMRLARQVTGGER